MYSISCFDSDLNQIMSLSFSFETKNEAIDYFNKLVDSKSLNPKIKFIELISGNTVLAEVDL